MWKSFLSFSLLLAGSAVRAEEVVDHSRDLQAADATLVDSSADVGRDLQGWSKRKYYSGAPPLATDTTALKSTTV